MAIDPDKGHSALRRGRTSAPEAQYFLTFCTAARRIGLATEPISTAILNEAQAMERDGTWVIHCLVVMSDHVHVLIELGGRLLLAKAMQRLKAKTAAVLRTKELEWERGFFDHRIRPNDDVQAVFLYIYLNPHRAGLVTRMKKWPYYFCRVKDWTWLQSLLESELPQPEWLR